MNAGRLLPQPTLRAQFSLRWAKDVPEAVGCYALTTFDQEIIYVGLTVNLRQRFKQHRDSDEKRGLTPKGRAFWFYYMLATREKIERIERGWINQHVELHGVRPALNRVDSPIR